MIKSGFDFNSGYFFVSVGDSLLFDTIVYKLKQSKFIYDSKDKRWYTQKLSVYKSVVEELSQMDSEFKPCPESIELCYDMIYQITDKVKPTKKAVNKELLDKFPPIIGKHPYENFQIDSLKKNIQYPSYIFDLDRGLGKSWIMLIALIDLYIKGDIDRALIVCRPEGVESTRIKLLKYSKGIFSENDIQTVYTEDGLIDDFFDKKIIITNYNSFRIAVQKKYRKRKGVSPTSKGVKAKTPVYDFTKWGKKVACFLDEAQSIKDPNALQSLALHNHSELFSNKYLYSGTLGFSILEYYSYMKFLNKKLISLNFSDWKSLIAEIGTHWSDWAIGKFKENEVNILKKLL